jgi:two-component system, NarL family, invasion response regulator UvrY
MYEDAIFVRRALDAGAAGYLTKASAPRMLVEAVDTVASGQHYLSPDLAHTLSTTPQASLSAREFEVLKLLVQGHAIGDIAQRLGVNPKTVANHQSAIKDKLGAGTAAQLYRIAMRLGLVPPA